MLFGVLIEDISTRFNSLSARLADFATHISTKANIKERRNLPRGPRAPNGDRSAYKRIGKRFINRRLEFGAEVELLTKLIPWVP
jgi:hypothetical protein